MILIYRQVLYALLLLAGLSFSSSSLSARDVAGAKDPLSLERFAGAHIVSYQESQPQSYTLILGELRRVDGIITPEDKQRFVRPERVEKATYQVPKGATSLEVFEHYTAQLKAMGAKRLFVCQQRACGSSNFWANRVFNVSFLYGPNQHQYYQVSEVVIEGVTHYLALYSIKRGNKRLYLHIENLTPKMDIMQSASTVSAQEKSPEEGYLKLPNLSFTEDDQLTSESLSELESFVKSLTGFNGKKLLIVAHLSGDSEIPSLLGRSKARAEQVKQALVAFDVEFDILEAYGVGPLAPASTQGKSEAIFLVLF